MQVAAKSYLTAGAALLGASAIAVAPIQVAPPDIKVPAIPMSSAAVEMTAVTNPITAWLGVIQGAFENTVAIGQDWLSDPAPVLQQFIQNQLGYGETVLAAGQGVIEAFVNYIDPSNQFGLVGQLQTAFEELASGNIAGAVNTATEALILGPILNLGLPLLSSGLLEIPATMAQNFANVVAALTNPAGALPLVLGGLGSILGPINAIGDSIQNVIDLAVGGDPLGAIGAALSAPAVIVGALVNGYTNLEGTEYPGLLTFGENAFSMGLVQALFVGLPRTIAEAITPPAEEEEVLRVAPDTESPGAEGGPGDTSTGSGDLLSISTASVTGEGEADDGAGEGAEGAGEEVGGTEGEEGEGADGESQEPGTGNGSTDLKGGNKVNPGDTPDGSEDDGSESPNSFDNVRDSLANAAGLGDADNAGADNAGDSDNADGGDGGTGSNAGGDSDGGSDGGSGGDE